MELYRDGRVLTRHCVVSVEESIHSNDEAHGYRQTWHNGFSDV